MFLAKKFLPALNGKFTLAARSPADVHQRATGKLAEVLSWEEGRVVAKDWTVAWNGRWFQINAEHEPMSLVGRAVTVRRQRSGAMQLLYGDKKLLWKELPQRPVPVKPEPRRVGRIALIKPKGEHPWRRSAVGAGTNFWRKERARGAAVKRARHQAATASGQPSLRSGFPTAVAV